MRISASFDPSHRYGCKLQQCTQTVREADFVIPSGLSTLYLNMGLAGSKSAIIASGQDRWWEEEFLATPL
jgi:hypothetical protein